MQKGEKNFSGYKSAGADIVINSEKNRLPVFWNRNGEGGADVVVDAVGTSRIMEEAIRILNSHGRLLLFRLNFK